MFLRKSRMWRRSDQTSNYKKTTKVYKRLGKASCRSKEINPNRNSDVRRPNTNITHHLLNTINTSEIQVWSGLTYYSHNIFLPQVFKAPVIGKNSRSHWPQGPDRPLPPPHSSIQYRAIRLPQKINNAKNSNVPHARKDTKGRGNLPTLAFGSCGLKFPMSLSQIK